MKKTEVSEAKKQKLRERYAGLAMMALIGKSISEEELAKYEGRAVRKADVFAEWAVEYANALIKKLEK